jgi:hypothetical protein
MEVRLFQVSARMTDAKPYGCYCYYIVAHRAQHLAPVLALTMPNSQSAFLGVA